MMMMMTSAQIRAAGQGSGGGGAQLLRAGCPRGGGCSCGAAVRRAVRTVLPRGLADKHQRSGWGGEGGVDAAFQDSQSCLPGVLSLSRWSNKRSRDAGRGGGPGAKPARVEPLGWWQREGSRGALPVARGEE